MTVAELIEELTDLDPTAKVLATDQWGSEEMPVTGIQVREGVQTTVLLDIELDVDEP